MRTLYTILIGIILLVIFRAIGYVVKKGSGKRLFTFVFLLVWFIATCWNMYHGVQLGYSISEELPFLLINFGIPSLFAGYLIFKSSR